MWNFLFLLCSQIISLITLFISQRFTYPIVFYHQCVVINKRNNIRSVSFYYIINHIMLPYKIVLPFNCYCGWPGDQSKNPPLFLFVVSLFFSSLLFVRNILLYTHTQLLLRPTYILFKSRKDGNERKTEKQAILQGGQWKIIGLTWLWREGGIPSSNSGLTRWSLYDYSFARLC